MDATAMADALVRACKDGRVDEVLSLVSRGADPNARNKRGSLPLCMAAQKGSIGCVKVCMGSAMGTMVMITGRAMKALLEGRADVNGTEARTGLTPLMNATLCDDDGKNVECTRVRKVAFERCCRAHLVRSCC